MSAWRAGCGASRTSGSEGGPGKRTGRKAGTAALVRPYWYALEERGFELLLVNARHVRILPGRKTDVGDAAWLAELLEHGLLRGSFVPPATIRVLRDLTRYRKRLIGARVSEGQRIEKTLADAGIRLDSVASEVMGVSGRAMLAALVAGERDPYVLADLAKGRLRRRIPELREALVGRFAGHHALLIGLALGHVEQLDEAIAVLDREVEAAIAPFAHARDLLDTIPGIDVRAAESIIAEMGADMTVFPDAAHLASWAGCSPGNNVTGGKRRSGRRRPAATAGCSRSSSSAPGPPPGPAGRTCPRSSGGWPGASARRRRRSRSPTPSS